MGSRFNRVICEAWTVALELPVLNIVRRSGEEPVHSGHVYLGISLVAAIHSDS
jgi:hypothetical protein